MQKLETYELLCKEFVTNPPTIDVYKVYKKYYSYLLTLPNRSESLETMFPGHFCIVMSVIGSGGFGFKIMRSDVWTTTNDTQLEDVLNKAMEIGRTSTEFSLKFISIDEKDCLYNVVGIKIILYNSNDQLTSMLWELS